MQLHQCQWKRPPRTDAGCNSTWLPPSPVHPLLDLVSWRVAPGPLSSGDQFWASAAQGRAPPHQVAVPGSADRPETPQPRVSLAPNLAPSSLRSGWARAAATPKGGRLGDPGPPGAFWKVYPKRQGCLGDWILLWFLTEKSWGRKSLNWELVGWGALSTAWSHRWPSLPKRPSPARAKRAKRESRASQCVRVCSRVRVSWARGIPNFLGSSTPGSRLGNGRREAVTSGHIL